MPESTRARPDTLLISDVVRLTGVASSALRFYERQGLVAPSGRRSGQRCYDSSILERIAFVDLCQRAGLTVREIAAVVHQDEDFGWRAVAQRRLESLDEQIRSIERARTALRHLLYCRHRSVAECPIVRASLAEHARRGHDGSGVISSAECAPSDAGSRAAGA